MPEYSQKEQVAIVEKAFLLETAIKMEKDVLAKLKGLEFKRFPIYEEVFYSPKPSIPKKKQAVLAIPDPPTADYSFGTFLKEKPYHIVLWLLFLPLIGYSVYAHSNEKKRLDHELATSPEYEKTVALAKQEAADKQAAYDEEYELALEKYNSETLPAYEEQERVNHEKHAEMKKEYIQEKRAWEKQRAECISLLESDLSANTSELSNLYNTTQLISVHYREIPLLEWLYDDMRSSDHDIRYATELLDRDRQRIVTVEAGARTTNAISRLAKQLEYDLGDIKALQGVQISSLRSIDSTLFSIDDKMDKAIFWEKANAGIGAYNAKGVHDIKESLADLGKRAR